MTKKKQHSNVVRGKKPVILFRQIKGNKPCHWIAGGHWYVEFHDSPNDMAFPLGIAFVSDLTAAGLPPCVDFVFVVDQERRKGIATELLKACQERWPDIWWTDGISDGGRGLIESMEGGSHDE